MSPFIFILCFSNCCWNSCCNNDCWNSCYQQRLLEQGKTTKQMFVPTIIVETVVPTMIVGTAVPTIIVLTAYYWKSRPLGGRVPRQSRSLGTQEILLGSLWVACDLNVTYIKWACLLTPSPPLGGEGSETVS